MDSRVILYLLTWAFAPCSYSHPSWCLCPATLGWCSAILINFCRVPHNVHISLKDFLSFHNILTMLSHFTDGVIEVHRSNISRIMLLLKGATGVKTRTSDSKSVLFLTHHSCPLVSCFSLLSLQSRFSIPHLHSFTLAPLLLPLRLLGLTSSLKASISVWQEHWNAKDPPSWLLLLGTSEVLLQAGSLPKLTLQSLVDTLLGCLMRNRKWGGQPGRHWAPCITRKRFLSFLSWTILSHARKGWRRGPQTMMCVCGWGLMGSKLWSCLCTEFSFVPPLYWMLSLPTETADSGSGCPALNPGFTINWAVWTGY